MDQRAVRWRAGLGAPQPVLRGRDGKRLQSSTAIVACGKHTVKTGAFRAARVIDVPAAGTSR